MNTETTESPAFDEFMHELAETAFTMLERACDQEIKEASFNKIDAVANVMSDKTKNVGAILVSALRAAPWAAEAIFYAAARDIAQAGIDELRKGSTNQTSGVAQ